MLDMTIVNVALPSIQSELDVPPSNLEWILNAYTLALASLILVGGALGDRYGRRRIFLAGLVVFTLGSLGCALSPDDPELIALRGLQGVGAAAMSPLTLSILVAAFPGPRAPGAIGLWAAVGSLGFGAGPVIGGLLVDTFDWSAVFWVNVPLGVLCGVVTLLAVQGVARPQGPAARPAGRGAGGGRAAGLDARADRHGDPRLAVARGRWRCWPSRRCWRPRSSGGRRARPSRWCRSTCSTTGGW